MPPSCLYGAYFDNLSRELLDNLNSTYMTEFNARYLNNEWFTGSYKFEQSKLRLPLFKATKTLVSRQQTSSITWYRFALLIKREVKMAGYWLSSFLRLYGPRRSCIGERKITVWIPSKGSSHPYFQSLTRKFTLSCPSSSRHYARAPRR